MVTPTNPANAQVGGGIGGLGQQLRDLFHGAVSRLVDKKKSTPRQIDPGYPHEKDIRERIKALVYRYYHESFFEKTQFARKWMRNILMFQGYHELEWSEINVAWEAVLRDSGEYAFPNNYFRSHVMYGVGLYVKNAPEFVFQPTANDFESYAIANAAKMALEVVKKNIQYDALRAKEAINLRLCGNSFRYSYYCLDPRYGMVQSPVVEETEVALDDGSFGCPICDAQGEGNPIACPACGWAEGLDIVPPTMASIPQVVGQTEYPRGQEMTEVVNPLEVYVRSSVKNLWEAPFLVRARPVDKIVLASMFPDAEIGGVEGASGEDLSLIYQESLADLPGDPTQYAAWYERAARASKTVLLQAWIRPSLYFHDKQMLKLFPDGLYAGVTGDNLLEAKNESLDDHWVHLQYIPVPGRFWADGDDDLIPKQLQLNEIDRLIVRNVAYNSVPQTWIDSQRIDKDSIVNDPGEINEVKPSGGKSIRDAIFMTEGQTLSQEVHVWRADVLSDFEYHSGVFGSAIGQHQPGVDTLGGQAMFAQRSEQNQSPMLLLYKEANESWARQMLKIVAENWLDERVSAVMGINGNWEFKKLRGAALDPDKVKIEARIIPQDYVTQQALTQAIATGALNPQDPRVARKLLEVYQLPTDLDNFSMDARVQWKEIEKMKEGQPVEPIAFIHNDAVHIEISRIWLNSDEAEDNPEAAQMVFGHMLRHMQNQLTVMQAQAAIQGASMTAGAAATGEGAAGAEGESKPRPGAKSPPPEAPTPQQRQRRARKGQAARSKGSQPSRGNQYGRGPV